MFFMTQAHQPILNIVLGKIMWKKLIRKICYDNRVMSRLSNDEFHLKREFREMRNQVSHKNATFLFQNLFQNF